jgi:type II secretory pathway predicted ATPase ExeA
MYHQFYGLRHDPFRLTPDGRDVYSHPSFDRARAYLEYGLLQAEGFVVVSGPPGSGKTTLSRALIAQLPPATQVAEVVTSRLEATDLLRMVAGGFGLALEHRDKASVIAALHQGLVGHARAGRRCLVVVDEAQDLPEESLEELRLLTNLTDRGYPLVQILLLGQPGLLAMLRRPELEQFHQRTLASCRLEPLKTDETVGYIRHRLRTAGWSGDPALTRAGMELIHFASGGIPRRINLIASRVLLHGYAEGLHRIGVGELLDVLHEMDDESVADWEPVARELAERERVEPEPPPPPPAEPRPAEPAYNEPAPAAGPAPVSYERYAHEPRVIDPEDDLTIGGDEREWRAAERPRGSGGGHRATVVAVALVLLALGIAATSIIPVNEILPSLLNGTGQ